MSDSIQPELFAPDPGDSVPTAGYAEVVFNRPLDQPYTYAVPVGMELTAGRRVVVPFGKGNRATIGYCVGITSQAPGREVKAIELVLDAESLVTPALMKLTRWMADYYLCGWGQVLNAVVPAGAKGQAGSRGITLVEAIAPMLRPNPPPRLSGQQKNALEQLDAAGQAIEINALARQANCEVGSIRGLIKKGLAQAKKGRVETAHLDDEPRTEPEARRSGPELTPDQAAVFHAIEPSLKEGAGFKAFLLHGVTGSGKTEIYLRAIEEVLRQGREVLVLVPEISLTPQTIRAFRGRCGDVAVLHSHLHESQRGAFWRKIFHGQLQVVVGARSAIFAPTRRLGLIVIDEEHENTFKQDTTPRYHARDVAVMRARLENIPILLGSATPSLESFYNAQRGQYQLLELPKRVLDLPMPHVHLVDLRHDRHPDKRLRGVSPSLEREMRRALDAGGQVILFLNRRGFSTQLLCPSCGHVEMCKFCDLALTYHKERDFAICHYCGFEEKPTQRCPKCEMMQIRYQGLGTEKLEAEILSKFPGREVRRMDSDTTRRPGSHKKILDAFHRGEIDILLGTQMIAKGLDFPNVTLVGVINADVGLHLADFRAPERTFQLLAQVAGRTGRGPRGGKVLVQSFSPELPSISLAAQHDYRTFAAAELIQRQKHHYPPFQRMARIVIRAKDEAVADAFAEKLSAAISASLKALGEISDPAHELRVLGPAEAPIFRLKGFFRFHFQLQSPSSGFLHEVLRRGVHSVRVPHGVEVMVDVDPQDMR